MYDLNVWEKAASDAQPLGEPSRQRENSRVTGVGITGLLVGWEMTVQGEGTACAEAWRWDTAVSLGLQCRFGMWAKRTPTDWLRWTPTAKSLWAAVSCRQLSEHLERAGIAIHS